MKKILAVIMGLFLVFGMMQTTALAADTEMRGAWVSTVYSIDWPKTKNNVQQQKKEFTDLLDNLKAVGMNTVIVQVRPKGDAIYNSSINPWSDILTGTQGTNPGYDPLAFMVDEAHKRGMELHAWFNPYRVTTSGTNINALSSNHPARKNPSWVVSDGKALYYNPGIPAVRKHIVDTVNEVVKNYNVDAVHFDDYFYKGNFNDDGTYQSYGNGMDKSTWRRNNVNLLVKEVGQSIKTIKPNVEFGISPSGIWKNQSSDPNGSATNGKESYSSDYADSVAWIKNNWIDYITPQLYWTIGQSGSDYSKLVEWWSNQVEGTNVDLYIGQGVYKPEVANQITAQINLNRKYKQVDGSMYFTTRDIIGNTGLQNSMKNLYFNQVTHKKVIGVDRYQTAAKISQEGWNSGSGTVLLVNGYASADGLAATPLASAYDAPILLTEKDNLIEFTKSEIKRLNPTKVILVGGSGVISNSVITQVKSINSNISVERLGGSTRYDTSLLVAKKLDQISDVKKAYVCYGYGEADALSIASKAGEEKAPIILSETQEVPKSTLDWLKGETLETAYFIGGTGIIYDNVVKQINSITSANITGNRVYGNNRYDTNAEVIKRFYSSENQPEIIVSKGTELADALTAGPLASKRKSPILILSSELNASQRKVLETKKIPKVYEIGGGMNPSSISEIIKVVE